MIYLFGALLAPYIAWIFTDDPNVSKLICLYLLIVPLAFGAQGVVILTNSTYNALLQPMKAMLLNIARLFVFVVPFVLIGSSVGDFRAVLVSVVLANIAAAILSYGVFRRTTGNFSQRQR